MKMHHRERGVAVVTALLLTTLAISIVASLFWQQQVQVRSMENQRLQLQTQWIERGALDWAGLVLQQDKQDNYQYTSLNQIWATPLAETRLDQYIERERVQGERYDATLSGSMIDATSRYNLFNLASGGAPVKDEVDVFARLLKNLQIDINLAQRTAQFVAASQGLAVVGGGTVSAGGGSGGSGGGSAGGTGGTIGGLDTAGGGEAGAGADASGGAGGGGGTGGAGGGGAGGGGGTGGAGGGGATQSGQRQSTVMKLVQVDDLLAIPGWTPELVEKIRPFAIVLPTNTPVNVNTAPAEVLSALSPALSLTTANSLVLRRKQAPYKDIGQFTAEALQGNGAQLPTQASVRSDWFLVESHIKLDRATLNVEALVSRVTAPALRQLGPHVVWIRQI